MPETATVACKPETCDCFAYLQLRWAFEDALKGYQSETAILGRWINLLGDLPIEEQLYETVICSFGEWYAL